MSRDVKVTLDVVIDDDADPETVVDLILDVLTATDDTETPGVVSFDAVDWREG